MQWCKGKCKRLCKLFNGCIKVVFKYIYVALISMIIICGLCKFTFVGFVGCMDEMCSNDVALGPCHMPLAFPALVVVIAYLLFALLLCNKKWGLSVV